MWEVESTDEFRTWYDTLDEPAFSAVNGTVDKLAEIGPGIRRPLAGHIKTSRHHNMRELVVPYSNLRVLFAFDPRRTAILLLGATRQTDGKSGTTRMCREPMTCTTRT